MNNTMFSVVRKVVRYFCSVSLEARISGFAVFCMSCSPTAKRLIPTDLPKNAANIDKYARICFPPGQRQDSNLFKDSLEAARDRLGGSHAYVF